MTILETKDPSEEKDYKVPWGPQLDEFGDSIASSSWIVPDGITKFDESFNANSATVWLKDGTEGEDYPVVSEIVTSSTPPRKLVQTILIRVRKR